MTLPVLAGWLTTICFNISYVPQLWKIYKSKSVSDISLGYLLFLAGAYTCGMIYSISIQAWPIVFSHVIGSSFLLCYLILYLKYQR